MKEIYEKYKDARDLSWRILIDFNLVNFPIDIIKLINDLDIELRTYGNNIETIDMFYPGEKPDAFTHGGIIYFDEKAYFPHIRFLLAHELGHCLLGHVSTDYEYSSYDENQANSFARSLIMPAIVIKEENLKTAKQIQEFFHVAANTAQYRRDRMEILYKRNEFGRHHLERQYHVLYMKSKQRK